MPRVGHETSTRLNQQPLRHEYIAGQRLIGSVQETPEHDELPAHTWLGAGRWDDRWWRRREIEAIRAAGPKALRPQHLNGVWCARPGFVCFGGENQRAEYSNLRWPKRSRTAGPAWRGQARMRRAGAVPTDAASGDAATPLLQLSPRSDRRRRTWPARIDPCTALILHGASPSAPRIFAPCAGN